MEHRFGKEKSLSRLKREDELADHLGVEQNEHDFEEYLKRKEKAWNLASLDSAEKMYSQSIDPKREKREPARNVEGESENSGSSTEIDGTSLPIESLSALSVGNSLGPDQKGTKLDLRNHGEGTIYAGKHITETIVDLEIDPEWKELFKKTYNSAVPKLTLEQVIEKFHKVDRAIYLLGAIRNALKPYAMEALLKSASEEERQQALKLDAEFRKRSRKARSARSEVENPDGPGSSSRPRSKRVSLSVNKSSLRSDSKGKTKAQKTVDTLYGLQMDQAEIESNCARQGLLDDMTRKYISGKFSGGAK